MKGTAAASVSAAAQVARWRQAHSDIVQFVPQLQKGFFHGGLDSTGATARGGVRALTVALPACRT